MIQLKHGINKQSGEIVSIQNVNSGLDCYCKCICCGFDLVAKKGNIKEHHFAHHNRDDCIHAGETAAHFMAKDIIKKHGVFMPRLHKLNEFREVVDFSFIDGKLVVFDDIFIEKRFDNFVPDIIGVKDGVEYVVEIAVTHFVDSEKKQKIINAGVAAIEIDLSEFRKSDDAEAIRKKITSNNYQTKTWINEPKTRAHLFADLNKNAIKKYVQNRRLIESDFEYSGDYEKGKLNVFLDMAKSFFQTQSNELHYAQIFKQNENGNYWARHPLNNEEFILIFKNKTGGFKCKVGDIWGKRIFKSHCDAMIAVLNYLTPLVAEKRNWLSYCKIDLENNFIANQEMAKLENDVIKHELNESFYFVHH
jgi:hypothetical protein